MVCPTRSRDQFLLDTTTHQGRGRIPTRLRANSRWPVQHTGRSACARESIARDRHMPALGAEAASSGPRHMGAVTLSHRDNPRDQLARRMLHVAWLPKRSRCLGVDVYALSKPARHRPAGARPKIGQVVRRNVARPGEDVGGRLPAIRSAISCRTASGCSATACVSARRWRQTSCS